MEATTPTTTPTTKAVEQACADLEALADELTAAYANLADLFVIQFEKYEQADQTADQIRAISARFRSRL